MKLSNYFQLLELVKKELKSFDSFLLFIVLVLFSSNVSFATIRYVKPSGLGNGDGSSWVKASSNLQAMIDASAANDEVWVMAGIYKPNVYPTSCSNCSSTRDYAFLLKNQVKLYGSFEGTETLLSQRTSATIAANSSTLSGDIGTVDLTSDNVYHVLLSLNDDITTILDGFFIIKGNANLTSGSIIVETFDISKSQGGGMYLGYNSSATINNCNFVLNNSYFEGGAMHTQNMYSTVTNCNFHNNSAGIGGAIWNTTSSPLMINCTISNNTASTAAGMYNYDASFPTLINCIFSNNIARSGGGAMINGANGNGRDSRSTLINCIFWGNKIRTILSNIEGNLSIVSYSNMEGGYDGTNNINQNPLFINAADPIGPDGILGTADDGLALQNNSPSIDVGDPGVTTPIKDRTGYLRSGIFDMGAYEFNPCSSSLIYVNDNAAGSNNGSSWANAFTSLESGLSAARSLNCLNIQIWVAGGTYKPSAYPQNITGSPSLSDRDFTFHLVNGVKMYGGFVGTETTISQRTKATITSSPSMLSGDIGALDDKIDNCYHVVLSVNDDNSTVFDGFTVTKGNTGDFSSSAISIESRNVNKGSGGGLGNSFSSPTLNNCNFIDNTAAWGGGINNETSSPIIKNCIFITNSTVLSGGGFGGAMRNAYSSSPTIINCTFSNNSTRSGFGGGIHNEQSSSPIITNCNFTGNFEWGEGGSGGGGAMYNWVNCSPIISNCTFHNNYGRIGGAIFNLNSNSNPIIKNSIFWGNLRNNIENAKGADIENEDYSTATISNTILQLSNNNINYPSGIIFGNGNLYATNPLFVNTADPDGTDNIFGTADDGLALQNCSSPAINLGNNADNLMVTDITEAARIQNGTIDMGAYERANGAFHIARLHVKANATGGNNGSSWTDALTNLQDALAYPCTNNEIWVAAGTYKPSAFPVTCINCTTDRDFAFLLKNQAKLYGGFVGFETSLSQRTVVTIASNPSILSGDIGTPTVTSDNVYHVLLSLNDDNSTILDGFTITKGNANGSGSVTIETFDVARNQGGGMYNGYNSSSIFNNCNFIANNSSFEGGAMLVQNNLSSFTNCNFSGNTSNRGGAVFGTHASPIYTNCTFSSNTATTAGAMYNWDGSSPILTNCSFSNNSAISDAGGMLNLAHSVFGDSNPTVKNGVFWGNRRGIAIVSSIEGSAAAVSFTDVEGGYAGTNNINQDPLFVNPSDPDGTDNIFATNDDGLALQSSSPVINLSDPTTKSPIKDITDFVRTIPFDLGAYEYRTCSNEVILNSTVYDYSSGTYVNLASSSSGKITATNKITGSTKVTYNAKIIELNPGFKADGGAVFLVAVGGCN